MLGNLPGMAGPWLTQYAQLLAQQDGAVVILHVDDEAIDLELVEPTTFASDPGSAPGSTPGSTPENASAKPRDSHPAALPTLRIPPGGFRGRDVVDVLDQLAKARNAPVRTFLVHLDAAPEALPRLLALGCWTLLSGADEAAIGAGYHLMKRLHEAQPRVHKIQLGLMIAGSDRDPAHQAARKLRAALGGFLHSPLEFIGYQQKMIPCRCRTLGRFTGTAEVWPRLAAWLAALQAPPTADRSADEEAKDASIVSESGLVGAEAASGSVAGAVPGVVPGAGVKSGPAFPRLDPPVHLDLHAPQPEFRDPGSERRIPDPGSRMPTPQPQAPDLFSLIDTDPRAAASIPGGLRLEARCPSQPDTQLALDAAGRLHLLHRHDSADGDPPTPREAIVELVAVRDWARQHRQLLQLTERARRFDPEADPILHLFTDRADLSVHLISRLGDLLKLHLLRDVQVGDQHTLFCTPLSA